MLSLALYLADDINYRAIPVLYYAGDSVGCLNRLRLAGHGSGKFVKLLNGDEFEIGFFQILFQLLIVSVLGIQRYAGLGHNCRNSFSRGCRG